MKKVVLTKPVFDQIVKSITNTDERKERILEEFFPEPSREREEIKEKLENYIMHIDNLLKNASVTEDGDNSLPFVIINSEVELLDTETQELFKFRIVSPIDNEVQTDDVSCISPLGKELLLKKPGDKVHVNAPGGDFDYLIRSVKYPFT